MRPNFSSILPALTVALPVFIASMLADSPSASEGETHRYWVFFRDKGITADQMSAALDMTTDGFSERARIRRERNHVRVNAGDLPLCSEYVARVASSGAVVRHGSRWLNAVSAEVTPAQLSRIEALDCVIRVQKFRAIRATLPESAARLRRSATDDPVYGPSFQQLALCRIPELHQRGLSGEGALICLLDTGYWLEHESLASVDIVATRDFLFNDEIVEDEPGQDSSGQHGHGTAVLSTIAGYRDSVLIGPAFGAHYALAKTEWGASEERFEEDAYVAAMEWADSLGADITSSSLGYILWYQYADLNGRTAVTTLALVEAQRRGILCVTSAGNNRTDDWFYIGTPADADSILAAGAVDSVGVLAGFSSGGPTADGRIKPDVSAMGLGVFCASFSGVDQYWQLSGTSLSAPIVAGVAALIMEANPDWTAQDVRRAVKSTASVASSPNNEIGWGVVDAVAAVDYDLDSPRAPEVTSTFQLLSVFPNPFNGTATLTLQFPRETVASVSLVDLSGREVSQMPDRYWPAGESEVPLAVESAASGVYFARVNSRVGSGTVKVVLLK